jgi:hypothetical protein
LNNREKPALRAKRDVTRTVSATDRRSFPSFDSLAAWAVEAGRAKSIESVREVERNLWGDLLFEWYAQGQIACLFAVALAQETESVRWYSAVLDGPWDANHVTGLIDAAAESGAEAIQLLFPAEGTAEEAVEIVKKLGGHERWSCEDTGWLQSEAGDSIQVGLRWISPGGDYESWALGIASFDPMPFTRCFKGAPFIALVIRPSPPAPDRAPVPTGTSGLPASHLAHMDDRLGENENKRKKWAHTTRTGKHALIRPEPLSRARAKVTFAFPASAHDSLLGVLAKQGS